MLLKPFSLFLLKIQFIVSSIIEKFFFFHYGQFTQGKNIKQLVLVCCITLLYIKLIFTSFHPKPQIM